jgi:sugar phosphate permease
VIRILSVASGNYPWVVVELCVVTTMAITSLFVGFGALNPFIQEDLGISRAQLGLISSAMMVGGCGTALAAGWLVDVMGVRRLQSLTLVGVVATLAIFSQARSFEQAVLLSLLMGVASAGSFPAFTKAIIDWVKPGARALAMGMTEAGIPLGGTGAALLLTFIAVNRDWRAAVLVLAAAIGASGMLFIIFYRDRPPVDTQRGGGARTAGRISQVLKNERIWIASFASASLGAVMSVVVTYLVLFQTEVLHMSSFVAGTSLAVSMAGAAVGRVGWGVVSDLFLGGRRIGLLMVVSVLSAASVALMTALSRDTPLALVLALVFFMGATAMGWTGLTGTLVAELAGPGATGTAIGLASTIIRIGPLLATPAFGWTVDRSGSYDMGWWIVVGLSGLAVLLLLLLGSRVRRA